MVKSILTLRLMFLKTDIELKSLKWLSNKNTEDVFISTAFALI